MAELRRELRAIAPYAFFLGASFVVLIAWDLSQRAQEHLLAWLGFTLAFFLWVPFGMVYRRLVRCRSRAELEQLEKDIRAAFGPYPPVVQTLLDLAEMRILCQPLKIRAINQQPPDLIFSVEDFRLVEPIFMNSPGSARIADANTVHLRLTEAYFEPSTLLAVLRKMLQTAGATTLVPSSR